MKNQPVTHNRLFNIRQANATLPLVRSIVREIVELSQKVIDTRRRISFVNESRDDDAKGADYYREETHAIAEAIAQDEERLAECIAELQDLGIEINELTRGLIDFPAERNGEKVFLSWQYGEPKIEHWRIPLPDGVLEDDPFLDAGAVSPPELSERLPLDVFFDEQDNETDCNLN